MLLVVDANVLLAGLLQDSTTRSLILDTRLALHAPEHLLEETMRHVMSDQRFRRRLGLSKHETEFVLTVLFKPMTVVPASRYRRHMKKAATLAPHPEDAPYLALALALKAHLWSNDRALARQTKVPVVTTRQLLQMLIR